MMWSQSPVVRQDADRVMFLFSGDPPIAEIRAAHGARSTLRDCSPRNATHDRSKPFIDTSTTPDGEDLADGLTHEIVHGLMLMVPATTRLAAWGVIALLIAVFPTSTWP